MNHTTVIVIIVLICIYIYTIRTVENYTGMTGDTEDTMNANYAAMLLYLQKNPQQSAKLISDLKMKFFSDQCTVKSNIDFNHLAQLPNGPVF